MSLRKQRDLWVLGIIYFFIGTVIFIVKGSALVWVSLLAIILIALSLFKVNKLLKNRELQRSEENTCT